MNILHFPIEINDCYSSPYENNSACKDLIGEFFRSGQLGFTGKQVETIIGELEHILNVTTITPVHTHMVSKAITARKILINVNYRFVPRIYPMKMTLELI